MDTAWFDARPSRRFRARRTADGFWLVLLAGPNEWHRVPADLQPERRPAADTDPDIATLWFAQLGRSLLFAKANRKSGQAGVRPTRGRK